MTPTESLSIVSRLMPQSLTASSPTTIPNWVLGSIFLTSFRFKWSRISKFFISQANFVLNFSGSKRVMGPAPLEPFSKLDQYSCLLLPMGVKAPIPVITTRFNSICFVVLNLFNVFFQISNRLSYRTDIFGLVVRDGNIKFFFKFHD